nr:hypothetical protein [Kribbella sp. VKM Ac-2527]
MNVDALGVDLQLVALVACHQTGSPRQSLSHSRRIDLQRPQRLRRLFIVPEQSYQALGRDQLVGRQREQSEQQAFLASALRQNFAIFDHFDRAKQTELHTAA